MKKTMLFNKNTILAFLTAVCLSVSFTGCASKDAGESVDPNSLEAIVNESVKDLRPAVQEAETVENSDELQDENGEAGDEQGKKAKKKNKKEKKSKKDKKNYTGWIDSSNRAIDVTYGNIRFKVKPKTGTFNILVVNDDGKSIPVLSTSNEYSTSSFYLLIGKKILKLNEDVSVKSTARKTENGVQLKYTVENQAEVIIDFSTFASNPKYDVDTVKVSGFVRNISKKKRDYALKLVLDTVLGETDRHHFYDSDGLPVKNETAVRNFNYSPFFTSKNANAAMQFILNGKDVSTPALAAFANYSTLASMSWEPDMLSYRTFDTVLSYNNSAVGIVWKTLQLQPEDTSKQVFYMSFAADGLIPMGAAYILDQPIPEQPVSPVIEKKNTVAEEIITPVKPAETPVVEDETVQQPEEPVKEIIQPAKSDEKQPEENEVPGLTDKRLSPEYIQSILNQIAALEDSGENVNKAELLMLNAELDAIMEMLKK